MTRETDIRYDLWTLTVATDHEPAAPETGTPEYTKIDAVILWATRNFVHVECEITDIIACEKILALCEKQWADEKERRLS